MLKTQFVISNKFIIHVYLKLCTENENHFAVSVISLEVKQQTKSPGYRGNKPHMTYFIRYRGHKPHRCTSSSLFVLYKI